MVYEMSKRVISTIILIFSIVAIFIIPMGCASAKFEVIQLTITPSQVNSGESVGVNAAINNSGSADGVYNASLIINGIERETKKVAIRQNGTQEVAFTITEQTPGIYNVSIGDKTATYTVLKQPTGDEIADNTIKAMYDVKTYQFEQKLFIAIKGIIDDEEADLDINIQYVGTVDKLNRKLWAEGRMDFQLLLPEEYEMSIGSEIYNIGNSCYTFTEYDGESSVWTKERWPLGSWENVSGVELELELLKSGTVTIVGSEDIRGRDCYILQIIPDKDRLADTIVEFSMTPSEELPLTESVIKELVEDSEVKHWVYKDDNYLAKYEISMRGAMTASMLEPGSKGFVDIEYKVTCINYNYNELVNIELPPDAEEAISLDGTGEQEAKDTEVATIQAAVHALMVDNELAMLSNPVTTPTDDMSAFPDLSICGIDKYSDVYGQKYIRGLDKDGFILYQHDRIADGLADTVNYVATRYSTYEYSIDSYGTVTQWE